MQLTTLIILSLTIFGALSEVIDLNPKTFDEQVLKSEVPFMVEFFAPWCGHCQSLAPEWDKAAKNLKGILPMGKVDCTQHQTLCGKYGVKGYPTIKCFSEKGSKVLDYQQARQATAIVTYATGQLSNTVVSVSNADGLDKFLAKDSDIPHAILFTSKSEVSPLMKVLAIKYKGRVAVGQVQQSVTEVVEKYKVESFPTLISVKGDEQTKYDGTITPEGVSAFISGIAGEPAQGGDSDSAEAPKPAAKPKAAAASAKVEEVTSETLEKTCENLCILGFVDVNEDRNVKEDQFKVLKDVAEHFKGDGKFTFGWVDRAKESAFAAKLSLSTSEPSFVVYNGKRQKFAKAEKFDEKVCHQLMERVVGGDVSYTKLEL